jgi:dihydroflavonol-4-reductase
MKVAITGATGLVGANLAEACLKAGHTVRATRRKTSKTGHLAHLDIDWVEADLGDEGSLKKAFEGAEAVFHCAAAVSILREAPDWMVDANVAGTTRILNALPKGARLVHCSSTVAVGLSTDGEPANEGASWNFADFGLDDGYSRTKRESERLVTEAVSRGEVDAVIVNPGFMFGPYDIKPSSGKMIVDVVKGSVPAYSTGSNNFVNVRDVCAGMLLALEKGVSGERYILGNENLPYKDAFGRIAAVAGAKAPGFAAPFWLALPIGWAGDLQYAVTGKEPLLTSNALRWGYCERFIFSSDKARRELGYSPTPIEDGIQAALDWFKETGRLG